jgi:UDP-N-acetylmuramoyl-tripeptide--D-alanyl-D-alanine ligase
MLNNMKSNYRRIAILGDMFELGETSTSKHKEVGRAINNFDIHEILTVGVDSYQIFKAIEDDKKIKKHFNTKKELKKYLVNKNYSQTIVLIKGSRGMKLEEITEYLQTRIK